jgi:hypothetical protein
MIWSSGYGDPPVLKIVSILRNIDRVIRDNLDKVEFSDPTLRGATSDPCDAAELDDTDK